MVLGCAATPQLLFGCDTEPDTTASDARSQAADSGRESPLLTAQPPPVDESEFEGIVEQRLPAGGYTYLAVASADGTRCWVATMGEGEPRGTRVRVRSMAVKQDFRSRRLDRTFEHLVFGMVSSS